MKKYLIGSIFLLSIVAALFPQITYAIAQITFNKYFTPYFYHLLHYPISPLDAYYLSISPFNACNFPISPFNACNFSISPFNTYYLNIMQNAEYMFGITIRHAFASVNGLYVTPGPFSFYRRAIVEKLGGFRYGHQTEDMEMALRIQQAGHKIENAPRARVYTKAPETISKLLKQRTRWTSGFLRNILGEYKNLIVNRKNEALGMLVLPTALMAVGSSIFLFALMLFEFTRNTITAFEVRAGIPLSYAFLPNGSFDIFYFPTNFYLFFGVVTLLASFFLIMIGKRISKTPGNLFFGIVSYTFLYGLIVPLWLIRATSDVALGKRRGWRY